MIRPKNSSGVPHRQSPLGQSLLVAMVGRWHGESDEVLRQCEILGEETAKRGHILITGGGPGAMEAASRGAKASNGITVGILGGLDKAEANQFVDIPITTGLGDDARSIILARTCDALVMVGGSNGSLLEVCAGYFHSKPLVILVGSGGWADRLPSSLVSGRFMDERGNVTINFATSPKQCLDLVERQFPPPKGSKRGW